MNKPNQTVLNNDIIAPCPDFVVERCSREMNGDVTLGSAAAKREVFFGKLAL